MRRVDIAGQRYGRLVVLARAVRPSRNTHWSCRCDCGRETVVGMPNLRSGRTASCGCLWLDRTKEKALHLACGPEYVSAQNARRRCTDPTGAKWDRYGGRGIEYRLPWSPSKAAALLIEHLGKRPDGQTLDRIDNDGHYEIGNLRRASPLEQRHNQTREKQKVAS